MSNLPPQRPQPLVSTQSTTKVAENYVNKSRKLRYALLHAPIGPILAIINNSNPTSREYAFALKKLTASAKKLEVVFKVLSPEQNILACTSHDLVENIVNYNSPLRSLPLGIYLDKQVFATNNELPVIPDLILTERDKKPSGNSYKITETINAAQAIESGTTTQTSKPALPLLLATILVNADDGECDSDSDSDSDSDCRKK